MAAKLRRRLNDERRAPAGKFVDKDGHVLVYAGEIERSRPRSAGRAFTVVVIDLRGEGSWAGNEEQGGRWLCLVDETGEICQFETREESHRARPHPAEWAPQVAKALAKSSKTR